MSHGPTIRIGVRAALLGLVAAAVALGGCRGDREDKPPRQFFPGMDDQPKYKPQTSSDFFADGRSQRRPPDGVVAFSRFVPRDTGEPMDIGLSESGVNTQVPALAFGGDVSQRDVARRWTSNMRRDLVREGGPVYTGKTADGGYLEEIPVAAMVGYAPDESLPPDVVRRFVERGRDRYMIFCYPCHGALGDGKGPVGNLWSAPLPNFHDPQYQPDGEKGQDGYLFWTIRNGVPNAPGQLPRLRMPAYAEKLPPDDAWAVVAYLRALQQARQGTLEDVPEAERQRLEQQAPATGQGDGSQASAEAADAVSGE